MDLEDKLEDVNFNFNDPIQSPEMKMPSVIESKNIKNKRTPPKFDKEKKRTKIEHDY